MISKVMILGLIGILLLLGLAIGLAIFWFQRYNSPDPSPVVIRLKNIKERHIEDVTEQEQRLNVNLKQLLKQSGYANEKIGHVLERFFLTHTLKTKLRQAGISTSVDRFMFKFMLFPVLAGLAAALVLQNFVPVLLAGVSQAGIWVWLNIKINGRLGRFNTQLPDALGLITTSLRAGHAFNSAVANVAADMSDPIATDFGQVAGDMNLGIPVKQALEKLAQNLNGLPDVRMFATAVIIQRESGGNLAEVLDKLGVTIRERYKLKRHVSAMTGQARLTGYVLGCAPITLLVILSVISYKYVEPLFTSELGHIFLGVGFILQVIGFTIMKKIVSIRV